MCKLIMLGVKRSALFFFCKKCMKHNYFYVCDLFNYKLYV
jgi:hypothetical protein